MIPAGVPRLINARRSTAEACGRNTAVLSRRSASGGGMARVLTTACSFGESLSEVKKLLLAVLMLCIMST